MPISLEEHCRQWEEERIKERLEERIKESLAKMPPEQRTAQISTADLERLLEERRAAEAAAKKGGKAGKAAPKRKRT